MIYRRNEDNVLESNLDGELVLLNLSTDRFYALKDTGLAIWKLVDGERKADEIQHLISRKYDIDDATCREKVTEFLRVLSDAGFIVEA